MNMYFSNKTSLLNYPKIKGDAVNFPLLTFKPKLAIGQGYFRWKSQEELTQDHSILDLKGTLAI